MNIKNATEIFSIDNIANEDEQSLKSKYKKLMIKYHPDNYNGNDDKAKDISIAFKALKEAIGKINEFNRTNNKSSVNTVIISINDLVRLYKDKQLIFRNKEDSSKTKKIGIADLHNNGAFILLDWTVNVNGVDFQFSSVNNWNYSDKYKVNCDIIVNDLLDDCNIKVKLVDKVKEYTFKSQSIRLNLVLDFNICVEIVINKKVDSEDIKRE